VQEAVRCRVFAFLPNLVRSKNWEEQLLASSFLSARMSVCLPGKTWVSTVRIFMKFGIWDFSKICHEIWSL